MARQIDTNPWQKRALKERQGQKVEMVYCPYCKRYCWAEVLEEGYRCTGCGITFKKEEK